MHAHGGFTSYSPSPYACLSKLVWNGVINSKVGVSSSLMGSMGISEPVALGPRKQEKIEKVKSAKSFLISPTSVSILSHADNNKKSGHSTE